MFLCFIGSSGHFGIYSNLLIYLKHLRTTHLNLVLYKIAHHYYYTLFHTHRHKQTNKQTNRHTHTHILTQILQFFLINDSAKVFFNEQKVDWQMVTQLFTSYNRSINKKYTLIGKGGGSSRLRDVKIHNGRIMGWYRMETANICT